MKEFINWSAVSEKLTGSKFKIRKDLKVPQEHEKSVKKLLNYVKKWEKELE